MDSKGDLIEPFLQLASIRDRLVVVGPDNPVGLNPLDIPHQDINKAVDNLEYLFSSLLEFKLTGTQSMLLRAVLRALVTSFKQPTLETFRDILANGVKAYPQQIQSLPPDLRDFFTKEFDTENIKHRRQEVLQRLRLLLDNDVMKEMLLAPFTTFHIGEAMDDGKIIIIDNSKGKLGEQAAEFFGRFFIAQVLAAAQQRSFRPASTKRPVYFYIDEAQSVIARDEKITTVLHECRAQKIALILAHQEMVQLSDKVLSAVQNCAIRFANPDEEAPKLVRTLRTDIDQLRALKRGQFAAYIRDFSASGLVVDVEQTDFSSLPSLPPPKPVRRIAAQVAVTEPPVPEFGRRRSPRIGPSSRSGSATEPPIPASPPPTGSQRTAMPKLKRGSTFQKNIFVSRRCSWCFSASPPSTRATVYRIRPGLYGETMDTARQSANAQFALDARSGHQSRGCTACGLSDRPRHRDLPAIGPLPLSAERYHSRFRRRQCQGALASAQSAVAQAEPLSVPSAPAAPERRSPITGP